MRCNRCSHELDRSERGTSWRAGARVARQRHRSCRSGSIRGTRLVVLELFGDIRSNGCCRHDPSKRVAQSPMDAHEPSCVSEAELRTVRGADGAIPKRNLVEHRSHCADSRIDVLRTICGDCLRVAVQAVCRARGVYFCAAARVDLVFDHPVAKER